MGEISAILLVAVLGGAGYCVWRLVRRARSQGDPEGHPRLRVIGVAMIAALAIGTIIAPTEEIDSDPAAQEQANEEAQLGEREGQEAEEARRDAEAREAERRRRKQGETGRVTDVIDGDTIEIAGVGRARLIGVDTPERGDECYDEATAFLERRVGGKTVRYRYQQEREDRYDRALLDIFHDGQLVNLDIAEAGWGEELTIAPNDRYADRIPAAEANARAEPRGRWAGCAPEPEPEPKPSPPAQEEDDSGGSGSSGGGGAAPSGTCSEIGITDFPVPPGDPRDRDGDGIACES